MEGGCRVRFLGLRRRGASGKIGNHMEAGNIESSGSGRAWRWGHFALFLAVGATWLALSGLNFWMGELNQDEGWYLYAAGQIREGRMPYRDFAFTQPPLMPLAYAAGYGWVEKFGIAGGRALTWVFGALGLASTAWLAMRAGPRGAQRLTAGLCVTLAAVNLYQAYFTTVVKTYSLAGMFLSAGLLALSFVGRRNGMRAAGVAGFLLACSAATRISMGAALPLGFLYLLGFQHRLKAWAWLDFGLGALVGLALAFLPFWAMGGDGFLFGVVEYHSLRESGPWLAQVAYKIGCLSRLAQAYLPAVAAALFLVVGVAYARGGRKEDGEGAQEAMAGPPHFNVLLWATAAAIAAVHMAAPFPYDDYQVPVYPIFCAAFAASAGRWWLGVERRLPGSETKERRSARRLAILTGAWLACSLHAFSSPLAQSWFVAGRDRIWWRLRETSPMGQIQDMGKWVRELATAEAGGELLTQDTYLAVEARMQVPRGLEMGPFSYYPDWPREKAERIGVMNRDMLAELLEGGTNASIAAFSGYGLSIRSPEVEEVSREDRMAFDRILEERFDPVESVPGFGQAGTTLEIWRRKKPEDIEAAMGGRVEADGE